MKKLKYILLSLLLLCSLEAYSIDIRTKGTASGKDLAATKKEALLVARKSLINEGEKIIYTWATMFYTDTPYKFDKVCKKVSIRASAYTVSEQVSKKDSIYTVEVTVKYGTSDKETTNELLDSFEYNMLRKDLILIKYNRNEAYKSLYKVVANW